jgi:hypothetical protein
MAEEDEGESPHMDTDKTDEEAQDTGLAFDSLPECHKWEHAIELECEPSPGFRKVYLMTLTEQTEIDAFLEEALATGHIR